MPYSKINVAGERVIERGKDAKGPYTRVKERDGGELKFRPIGGKKCPYFAQDPLEHFFQPVIKGFVSQNNSREESIPKKRRIRGARHGNIKLF